MRRLLLALLAFAVLAAPSVALAHDPLDDVTGEEDFTQKPDEQPRVSPRVKREQAEMARELQERDDTEFQLNQEKEEFLRDRADTRDVLAGIRRRNQLSGGVARPHHSERGPHRVDVQPTDAPAASAQPSADSPPRGDVDPTDPSASDSASSASSSDADGSSTKRKKKHHRH